MTDLSKELGEIKRRNDADKEWAATGGTFGLVDNESSRTDRSRLLSIIETEIPGMLRAAAQKIRLQGKELADGDLKAGSYGADAALEHAATLIESLTKNEKG